MTIELFFDRRLVARQADPASLGAALISLRASKDASLELSRSNQSLRLDKCAGFIHAALLDDEGGSTNVLNVSWDRAVEAAAEFLSGALPRAGGLLDELRQPGKPDDGCPLCQAMKNGLV